MSEIHEKAIGQFRMRCNGALGEIFGQYGQGVHVPRATDTILDFALDMHALLLSEATPAIVEMAVTETKRQIIEEFDRLLKEHKAEAEQEEKEGEIQPD